MKKLSKLALLIALAAFTTGTVYAQTSSKAGHKSSKAHHKGGKKSKKGQGGSTTPPPK